MKRRFVAWPSSTRKRTTKLTFATEVFLGRLSNIKHPNPSGGLISNRSGYAAFLSDGFAGRQSGRKEIDFQVRRCRDDKPSNWRSQVWFRSRIGMGTGLEFGPTTSRSNRKSQQRHIRARRGIRDARLGRPSEAKCLRAHDRSEGAEEQR